MKYTLCIAVALLAYCAGVPALAAVTASLEKNNVATGDTVRLLLQRDGGGGRQPDLSPLKQDFDMLGISSGSSVEIVNGNMSTKTQVEITLAPKHDGNLQIPSLQWSGEQSPALDLTVGGKGETAAPGAPGASHVFLTESVDQKQPYVQAAVVLTLRLYTDEPLAQASLDLPASGDVLVKQLGKDTPFSESRGGHDFNGIERKYMLFPQHSGRIEFDGPVLDAQVQGATNDEPFDGDRFFRNAFGGAPFGGLVQSTRPLHLRAKPIELDVLPRPPSVAGAAWLPAQAVTLAETWGPGNAVLHVGEPLTRHLHLAALGLSAAQLPDIGTLIQTPDGVKPYPNLAKLDDIVQGDTVLGSRDQDIALIANQPGHVTLPALRLAWWDTTRNVQREALLPARELDILPSLAAPTDDVPSTAVVRGPATPILSGGPAGRFDEWIKAPYASAWAWIAFAVVLLFLTSALIWWYGWKRRRNLPFKTEPSQQASVMDPRDALKSFQQACRANDPLTARKHLLAWARATWLDQPPLGLNALARLLGDPKVTEPLRELDRSCYAGGPWLGDHLAKTLVTSPNLKAPGAKENLLSELYP